MRYYNSISRYNSTKEHIDDINAIHDLIARHSKGMDKGPGGRVFAHANKYSTYVTMEIISSELVRNILLALVAVFLATLILITDLMASLLVAGNVFLTLVNVGRMSINSSIHNTFLAHWRYSS